MERNLYLICDASDEGAFPLYEKIGGGISLYVCSIPCAEDVYEVIREDADRYRLALCTKESSSAFMGFVAGMSYHDEEQTEYSRIADDALIVENGLEMLLFRGTFLKGRYYDRREDDLTEYEQLIFIDTDETPHRTHFTYALDVFGHDGEESETEWYRYAWLERK